MYVARFACIMQYPIKRPVGVLPIACVALSVLRLRLRLALRINALTLT